MHRTLTSTKAYLLMIFTIAVASTILFATVALAQEVPTGTLTLKKVVINEGGGTAVNTDWTLFAQGPISISGVTGAPSVTSALVPAGSYSLSESEGPAHYTASSWACNASLVNPFTVLVSPDEHTTCTITNYFVVPPPECSDRKDNDGDELTDFDSDPGCLNSEDTSEADEIINEPLVCESGFHVVEDECVVDEVADTQSSSSGSHRRSGGGGGGGNGEVLGASTCSPLLTAYLHIGWVNDPSEVTKLQQFLNEHLGLSLETSGIFGRETLSAVKQFQTKYGGDVLKPWIGLPGSGIEIEGENTPTGFVYQTTRWQINNIWCPGSEAFPQTLI